MPGVPLQDLEPKQQEEGLKTPMNRTARDELDVFKLQSTLPMLGMLIQFFSHPDK